MKKAVPKTGFIHSGSRSFIFTIFIFVFLVCSLQSFGQSQTVMTDTTDYVPGDTSIITGSGWVAGDTITVQVLHTDSVYPDSDYAEHQPWQILADSAGNIQTYWVVPHDAFGSSLVVTATDYALGYSAEYYFYDGLAYDAFQSRQSGIWNNQTTWMKGLTGTSVSFTSGSKTVTGTSTQFTSQLSVGDSLMLQSSSNIIRGVVDSIKSATLLVLKANATATVSGAYGKQGIPTTSDGAVEIMAGHTIEISANQAVHEVTIDSGGVMNVDTLVTLSVAHLSFGITTLTINGTLNLTGAMSSDSGSVIYINGYGTVNLNDTIKLSQHNTFVIDAGGALNIPATGCFDMNPTGAASLLDIYGTVNSSGSMLTGINSGSGTVVVAEIYSTGTVNLTGNATWDLTSTGTPELDLAGGTLSMGPNTVITGSNGVFTSGSGSTFKIGSTAGISSSGATGNLQIGYRTFSNYAIYNYNGTSPQVIGTGLPYGLSNTLIISNTSGVTPSGNIFFNVGSVGTLTVNGLFTPTSSQTITASTGVGTLNGSGTVLVTGSSLSAQYALPTKTLANLTVEYAGTSAQTLNAYTFGNLQINNSSNVALGGNTTVNGALTFAGGKITTGSYTLSMDSTAAISGDSAGKYVFGNMLWDVASGSPSLKFAVGDSLNYTPVTVNFTGVTTPGTLTVKTTKANDPHISTSGIDSTKEVKRYWTMTNASTVFSSYNTTFNFVSGDVIGGANPSYFILKEYSSSSWGLLTTGTLTSLSSQASGMTSFGDMSIGYPVCTASGNPTSASASPDTICHGGSATLTLSGGGGGTYQTIHWYTSSCGGTSAGTGNSLSVSPVTTTTTYYGRYEDTTACSYNSSCQSVTITVDSIILSSHVTNVSCYGGSNGIDSLHATNGASPYTYLWSPSGATTSIVSGLSAATYTVTVTDGHSCTTSATATITQPTALTASITSSTNVSCNGGSNGSATVSAGGGTAPYTYVWSPGGSTGSTASALVAGTYTVTVTDTHACTASATTTISQPTALTASIASSTNVSCNGGSNGSATVSVSGGTTSYIYSWSSGNTGATASGLSASTYTVTVSDAHSCATTATATITQPATLTASISSSTNVSCNGGNNGSATVSASGGTTAYAYSWSPGSGTNTTASNLSIGTYTVTATDAHSCLSTATVTITQPSALSASITSSTNVSCYGGSNGAATIAASGGTTSYEYFWSPSGGTGATASGLSSGTYIVTASDAHGCTATATNTITEPLALNAFSTATNISCYQGNDGAASVTANGGTSPYSYLWSPSGGTASIASNLSAGSYTVIVTDTHGCTITSTASVHSPVCTTHSRYHHSGTN